MSIIYDALKKVEKKVHPAQNETQGISVEKKRNPALTSYVVPVLIACFLIVAVGILFTTMRQKPQAPLAAPLKVSPQVSLPAAAPVVTQTPLPQTEASSQPSQPPQLTLNGIFFSQDGGYALINNEIVREGDVVQGVTVLRILADEVDLDYNGSPFKLSTK
jgi:hypothetical protein